MKQSFLTYSVLSMLLMGSAWADFDQGDPSYDPMGAVAVDPPEAEHLGGDPSHAGQNGMLQSGMPQSGMEGVADRRERTDHRRDATAAAEQGAGSLEKKSVKACLSAHVKKYKAAQCSGSSSQEEFRACSRSVKAAAKAEAKMVCGGNEETQEPVPFQPVNAEM